MEMETSKEGMGGAKLFERDPQLFDRRLETHRRLKGVTEKQREEYLDSLFIINPIGSKYRSK